MSFFPELVEFLEYILAQILFGEFAKILNFQRVLEASDDERSEPAEKNSGHERGTLLWTLIGVILHSIFLFSDR